MDKIEDDGTEELTQEHLKDILVKDVIEELSRWRKADIIEWVAEKLTYKEMKEFMENEV